MACKVISISEKRKAPLWRDSVHPAWPHEAALVEAALPYCMHARYHKAASVFRRLTTSPATSSLQIQQQLSPNCSICPVACRGSCTSLFNLCKCTTSASVSVYLLIAICLQIFLQAIQLFLEQRSQDVGAAVFDKDDDLAVEFVTAAANLRSIAYNIPTQSLFAAKVHCSCCLLVT